MYCKHCGKELSDEAIMCPDCGTPTEKGSARKPERISGTPQKRTCAVTGFVLSIICFVATFVLVTIEMCFGRLGTTDTLAILPGLAGLIFSIFGLGEAKKNGDGVARGLAITGIVLSAVALFYCFIIYAVFLSVPYNDYYDYYY